ncbi:MAG: alpha/beta hydrolase, partial [Nitrososphaeraceae archaeon]
MSNLQLNVPTLWIRMKTRRMIMVMITLSVAASAVTFIPILIMSHTIHPDLQISYYALAQNSSTQNATYQNLPIPTTISKEAQEELRNTTFDPSMLKAPDPDDLIGWKKQYLDSESIFMALSQSIIDLYQPNISEIMLDGIQVLDIKPQNWTDNGKVLVYVHGGGYTFGSANSTLGIPVLVSNATGLRVMSINYTVAPFSKWNQTTDQMVSVIQMLKEQLGYSLDDIAAYGDSAGGGLVTGSILKMRDQGLGLPAALVLWSPWVDLTG